MDKNNPTCLYCDRSSELVPLLNLEYRGEHYWICPQHLPILIHEPGKLASYLPGLEEIAAADHDG